MYSWVSGNFRNMQLATGRAGLLLAALLVLAGAACCAGLAGFIAAFARCYAGDESLIFFQTQPISSHFSLLQLVCKLHMCRWAKQQQRLHRSLDLWCCCANGCSSSLCDHQAKLHHQRSARSPFSCLGVVCCLDVQVRLQSCLQLKEIGIEAAACWATFGAAD